MSLLLGSIEAMSNAFHEATGRATFVLVVKAAQFEALRRETEGLRSIGAKPSYMGVMDDAAGLVGAFVEIRIACPGGEVVVRREEMAKLVTTTPVFTTKGRMP